ncbi:peroxide stress protein YaaA [Alphaproteobacteria bacterium KMM 3653]|uniref:UPF0246 protein IV417_08895 n=1 Tax=Harenicola maris TaxID=2841044 RepID=A0AAP2CP48_9RHOB|nr:peroxide stress protein YaaA [Harenicola maris]
MLCVISPAKRLDWEEVPSVQVTQPAFGEDAVSLARTARRLSKPALQKLMGLSVDLARLNQERFASFEEAPSAEITRPAMHAFAGDTYTGLEAASLDADAVQWAQGHLRILSGLYGLLRPLDAIQPYRLEMGCRLATRRGKTLYAYWGDRLALGLNALAEEQKAGVLVNCASQEYFGAVDLKALRIPVVTPVFMEEKPSGPKIVSFFAKRARGAMARYIAENRLVDPEALHEFDTGGYAYTPELSEPGKPVFIRPLAAAQPEEARLAS